MPKLPRLTARQIIAVLEKVGFSLARQSGSHMIYKNASGKRATVPFRSSRTLRPKVLSIEAKRDHRKLSKLLVLLLEEALKQRQQQRLQSKEQAA